MKTMKLKRKLFAIAALLILLSGCSENAILESTEISVTETTVTGESPEAATRDTDPTESPEVTEVTVPEATTEATLPEETNPPVNATEPHQTAGKEKDQLPAQTEPPQNPVPVETDSPETEPPEETSSPGTQPPETAPEETNPPESNLPEKEPVETDPSVTEAMQSSEAFKREVARAAAKYLNRYRDQSGVKSCTILPGMTLVAEYRADQLTWDFSHSTQDKREALAYYRYGRYVDATLAGLEESDSYYEADSAEAICAGFHGPDADAMGKYIADQIRNSSSHWRYIGSDEYSYIGVGVEYREGSRYGWYACIMVGMVDYG